MLGKGGELFCPQTQDQICLGQGIEKFNKIIYNYLRKNPRPPQFVVRFQPKSNQLLISMHQNYMGNFVLIFTLVFELERTQNLVTYVLTNVPTNKCVLK